MIIRFLKWICITLIMSLLFGGAFLYWKVERPDVYKHPVSAAIVSNNPEWGELVDLIPDAFVFGEERDSVRQKLQSAGYQSVQDKSVWKRYSYLIEDDYKLYSREADNLVCNIQLRVFVKFNSDDLLAAAKGNIHEQGCL